MMMVMLVYGPVEGIGKAHRLVGGESVLMRWDKRRVMRNKNNKEKKRKAKTDGRRLIRSHDRSYSLHAHSHASSVQIRTQKNTIYSQAGH